jgi:hypothetical protein
MQNKQGGTKMTLPPTARYAEGTDYTVESPHTANGHPQAIDSRELNLTVLMPSVLRRVVGGRIAAGAEVRLSYDYLPGKVDSQQHIPMAFGEPVYYEFMDRVLENLVRAFPGITAVHLNHDEIRGMARDSRSLRSGLSNAALLAKDINTLQVRKTSSWPRSWAYFSLYSSIPIGMHGPTCIVWASLTRLPLGGPGHQAHGRARAGDNVGRHGEHHHFVRYRCVSSATQDPT